MFLTAAAGETVVIIIDTGERFDPVVVSGIVTKSLENGFIILFFFMFFIIRVDLRRRWMRIATLETDASRREKQLDIIVVVVDFIIIIIIVCVHIRAYIGHRSRRRVAQLNRSRR